MTILRQISLAGKDRGQGRTSNRMRSTKAAVSAIVLLLGLLAGCGKAPAEPEPKGGGVSPQAAAPVIVALHPDAADAGKVFNAQPNGSSALAITCQQATNHAVIVFAGERLPTVYGGPTLLTAEVDKRLYAKAGTYQIYLDDNGTRSNTVFFTVY